VCALKVKNIMPMAVPRDKPCVLGQNKAGWEGASSIFAPVHMRALRFRLAENRIDQDS